MATALAPDTHDYVIKDISLAAFGRKEIGAASGVFFAVRDMHISTTVLILTVFALSRLFFWDPHSRL